MLQTFVGIVFNDALERICKGFHRAARRRPEATRHRQNAEGDWHKWDDYDFAFFSQACFFSQIKARRGAVGRLIPLLEHEAAWKDVKVQADIPVKAESAVTQTDMTRSDFEQQGPGLGRVADASSGGHVDEGSPKKQRRRQGYLGDLVCICPVWAALLTSFLQKKYKTSSRN